MKYMNLFLLSLSVLFIKDAKANLTCSRTGTTILYVNGIKTEGPANKATAKNINEALLGIKSRIDNRVSDVKGVHNVTRSGLIDIDETKAQIAINHKEVKREEYWKKMALTALTFTNTRRADLKKQIEDGFDQLYKTKRRIKLNNNNEKIVDPDYFTQMDLYKTLLQYEPLVASIYAHAYTEDATIEELKNKILEGYNGGKGKVIIVAHSQGNEVLYSAITRINAQAPLGGLIPESLTQWSSVNNSWFNSVAGYVQVAPPSPRLVAPSPNSDYLSDLPKTNHSRYLRFNFDAIIGLAPITNGVSALPANLEFDLGETALVSSKALSIYEILAKMNIVSTAAYHSIDDLYLSKVFSAKDGAGNSKTMLQHFQNAIVEVAEELEDNCPVVVPPPSRALCQVWARSSGGIEYDIFFADKDKLLGVEFNLPNPVENSYKFVGSSCGRVDSANGAAVSSQGLWCLGENNRVVIQSIGEDTIVNYPYTSPCYVGRVFGQNGVVPL